MQHKVSIVRVEGSQIAAAVREAVDLVGGIAEYVSPGSQVLVKPNLVADLHWSTGATTNPLVVEALVDMAWEAGARRVIVGEGTSVGIDTWKVFRVTEYDKMAERCHAELVDLNTSDQVLIRIPQGVALKSVPVARLALDSDVVTNVPMLKTHLQTKATISLKNMKGVLPPEGKRKDHFVGLEQAIADMNTILKQHLVVIDGTRGQEGMGPVSGRPVDLGLILASDNPVAADAVAVQIMGFEPTEIEHLMLAEELGLGSTTDFTLLGETIEAVRRPFERCPTEVTGAYAGIELIERTACSGCMGSLVVALERMRQAGELDEVQRQHGSLQLLVGRDAVPMGESTRILVGRCQKRNREAGIYIPGCPPTGFIVRDVVRKTIGLPPLFDMEDWFAFEEDPALEEEQPPKD